MTSIRQTYIAPTPGKPASGKHGYSAEQYRALLDLADLLLLQEVAMAKLREKTNTKQFWNQAQFNERVEELIGEHAARCESENLHREFALLVSGWPQAQEQRSSWTAEVLVEAAANTLVGILNKHAG
jgi:hypothetical protein